MGLRLRRFFSPARLIFATVTAAVVCLAFLPALAQATTAEEICASNLRHLGLALRLYANDYDGYLPPHGQRAAAGGSPAEQAAFKAAFTPYLYGLPDSVWYCPADQHARTHFGRDDGTGGLPPVPERPAPYSDCQIDHFYTSYRFYGDLPVAPAPGRLDSIVTMTSKNHPGGFWTASPDMLHLMMEDWPYHGAGQPGALGSSTPQYGKYVLFRDGHVAFMTEETSRRGTGLVLPSAAPAGPAAATPSGPAVTPSGSSVAARGIYETASAALMQDRPDDAVAAFNQVVTDHPTTLEARKARLVLAWVKEDAGDFAAAEAQHQALIAAAPDTPQAAEAAAHIVLLRLRHNDQAGARAQLEAILAAHSGTEAAARARYGLGDLDWIARSYDAAEAQWQQVSADYPTSPESWEAQVHLAQIHLEGAWLAYQQGDWQKTIRYATPALTDPGMAVVRARFHLTVLEMLAYSQKNLGHYAEAVGYLQQIVDHYPFHLVAAFAQLNLGDCYRQLGDNAKARAAYETLLEKDPDGPLKPHTLLRLKEIP